MNNFTLELLFNIIGIGPASGLVYKDHTLLLIGDNSGFLYEYRLDDAALTHHALLERPAAHMSKDQKPDFEAVASDDDKIYVFGSGSTANRNKMVAIDKVSKTVIATVDLTNLYLSMQSLAHIKPQDFNIEGVAKDGHTWYFLQRGNGASGKNGLFTVQANDLELDFAIVYNALKLPKIKGVRASFTDAALVGNQLYFLAAAEDSKSTYEDGRVLGSIIGNIDLDRMTIGGTRIISASKKFEGLVVFTRSDAQIEFLLCEDNDTEAMESAIYKLTLRR